MPRYLAKRLWAHNKWVGVDKSYCLLNIPRKFAQTKPFINTPGVMFHLWIRFTVITPHSSAGVSHAELRPLLCICCTSVLIYWLHSTTQGSAGCCQVMRVRGKNFSWIGGGKLACFLHTDTPQHVINIAWGFLYLHTRFQCFRETRAISVKLQYPDGAVKMVKKYSVKWLTMRTKPMPF